jgi:hypothetical protein
MTNLMNFKEHGVESDLMRLKYDTIQTSAQIQKNRRSDESLQSMSFFTRDFAVYSKNKKGEPMLNIISDINLIFLNAHFALEDIRRNDNYMNGNSELISKIVSNPNTLSIELKDLKIRENKREEGYFNVNTKKYKSNLNSAQKLLIERLNGSGEDLEKVMELYARNKHDNILIDVLTPEYVLSIFNWHSTVKFLGRGVMLGGMDSDSKPYFSVKSVFYNTLGVYLRGVPEHEGGRSGFEAYIDTHYR